MIDPDSLQSTVGSNGGGPPPTPVSSPPLVLDAAGAAAVAKASAIRQAFSLGWSIQELKSRVLLAALGLPSSPLPDDRAAASTGGEVAASTGGDNPASSTENTEATASTGGDNTASSTENTGATASADDNTASSTENAGATASRSAPAPYTASRLINVDELLQAFASPSLATILAGTAAHNTGSELIYTNDWRALFIRIAVIHSQCFPGSTTRNTPYDPSPVCDIKETFPYLYPAVTATSPDYALVGINDTGSIGIGDLNSNDQQMKNFALYDVTRRALNCLALLYTNPEGSLIPDVINTYQARIVQAIFSHVRASEIFSRSDEESLDREVLEAVVENLEEDAVRILRAYVYEASARPSQESLNLAIKILSFLVAHFLESWYGYQSENFYAGGRIKNNELELLGYEAGSSLASFAWSMSLVALQLEEKCQRELNSQELQKELQDAWKRLFEHAPLNLVQRQISALGPALDDAYFAVKKVPPPARGEKPGAEQPGTAIRIIVHSLLYWQHAIQWICQPHPTTTQVTMATPVTVDTTTTVETPVSTAVVNTTADTEIRTTTTITASLASESAPPPTLTVDLSRQMRQALIDQAEVWRSLILGEQTLNSFSTESVTRRIMSTIMQNFEDNVRSRLTQSSEDTFKRYRIPLIAGGVVLLIILVGGALLLAITNQLPSLVAIFGILIGGIITSATAFFTRLNSLETEGQGVLKNAVGSVGSAAIISGLLSLAGGEVASIFQNAYKQIKLEFSDLNHCVAISYPLIDFFVLHSEKIDREIKDGYIFLTKVVLPENELRDDIEKVSRAAFGPLSAWLTPQNVEKAVQNVSKPGTQNQPKQA